MGNIHRQRKNAFTTKTPRKIKSLCPQRVSQLLLSR